MLHIPFAIETFEHVVSTQDLMRERLERGENVHGLVIRALAQTGARGQRARDWQSKPGGSYQTLAVKDLPNAILNKPYSAIMIALGLAQTMPEYGIQVGIKWPNDLYYRGKKLAGILCEYCRGHLLIGIGMNVNNPVPQGATSLRGLSVEGVSGFVLAGMQKGLKLLEQGTELETDFAKFDILYDQVISLEYQGKHLEGQAKGIDKNACLKLLVKDGLSLICHGHVRSAIQMPRKNDA